jgi:dTDP-4-dehydrorhamnose 3,5-epimerase
MHVEQLTTASGQVMDGPLLITPQIFGDDRGFFYESWNQQRFDGAAGRADSKCVTGILAMAASMG